MYPGVLAGWQRLVERGLVEDFTPLALDDRAMADHLVAGTMVEDVVDRNDVDTLVLHHFHASGAADPRPWLDRVRSRHPSLFVSVSNGDAFMNGLLGRPSLPRSFLHATEHADLVHSTSMGRIADLIASRTPAPVVLLPLGVHGARHDVSTNRSPVAPEYDVVFIGSRNMPRNVFRGYHSRARRRVELVERLAETFGDRFAVYGSNWGGVQGWRGSVAVEEQWDVVRRARVVVGGYPFSDCRYYLSNRAFVHIAAGVPFVDIHVEGIETLLRDGEHWHLVRDIDGVIERCGQLLSVSEGERREQGTLAAQFVLGSHSEIARVGSEFDNIEAVRGAREKRPAHPPGFSMFLPEVERQPELSLATRNWS